MEETVRILLAQALDDNPSLFLIDCTIQGNNEIKIVIDGDQGVTVQDCITVSRAIEHNLDRDAIDFSLDVLSAGATAPLTQLRQYKKNVGRTLVVKTANGEKLEGTLEQATDQDITLSWKAREPKPVGKGKITVKKTATLVYDAIERAKVKLKF